MFSIFMYAVNAILPLILIIGAGILFRQTGLISHEFVKTGNKFLFRFVLPVMVTLNIYDIPDLSHVPWDILIYAYAAIFFLFLLGIAVSLIFFKDAGTRGVITQCAFRSNYAILGLPLAKGLVASGNTIVASLLTAFIVPLYSFLAVFALTMFSDKNDENHNLRSVVREIVKNPLIISAVTGLLLLLIRSMLPLNADGEIIFSIKRDLPFLYSAASTVSKSATFLSLIVLGGLLDFSAVRGKLYALSVGTIVRTIVAPIIGLSGAYWLASIGVINCGPAEYAALIALFGSPVAISSAIMAAEMHADAELARQLVVWTSLTPMVTLFIFVMAFRYMGLI